MQLLDNSKHEGARLEKLQCVCPRYDPIDPTRRHYVALPSRIGRSIHCSRRICDSKADRTTCRMNHLEKKLCRHDLGWALFLQNYQVPVQFRAFYDRLLSFLLRTNAGSPSGSEVGRRDSAKLASIPLLVEQGHCPCREIWKWAGEVQTDGNWWLRRFLASAPPSPPSTCGIQIKSTCSCK